MSNALPFRPSKKLGQNILIDENVVQRFIQAADLKKNDIVLEVGPGTGVITVEAARWVKKIIAVEKDPRMAEVLRRKLQDYDLYDRVQIVNKDILKCQMSNVKCQKNGKIKVVGAIPYSITSPLIHKLLEELSEGVLIILIIQNEVANKIIARKQGLAYVAAFVQSLAQVTCVGKKIPPSAFWPRPDVYSRIISMQTKKSWIREEGRIEQWEHFLHTAFLHPRKMVKRVFQEEELQKAGILSSLRPGEVSIYQWEHMFRTKK